MPIHPDDNVESVHDRMKELGAKVILKTVNDIAAGTITRQNKTTARSPKHQRSFTMIVSLISIVM